MLAVCCAFALLGIAWAQDEEEPMVITVQGPVKVSELGRVLTHEHVMVDFIGADKVSPDRYDRAEVRAVMLPYLLNLKAAGVETLMECTPEFIGRDVALLRELSEASGVRLVTNTGWYKDPFLPPRAYELTAEQIAAEWIAEAREGIGGTGIRPGFIKIAVNPGELIEVQAKIVRAAALTSKATGLVIASHTGSNVAAEQELGILESEGLPESRLIIVHCDAEPDIEAHGRLAARGAWLSYDGIREGNAAEKVTLVVEAYRRWPGQLLISQDAGWYNVGTPGGGEVAALDWLPRHFLPLLREAGLTEDDIEQLMVRNPARAFAVTEVAPQDG
jgi:phosphotriesterase-related protein